MVILKFRLGLDENVIGGSFDKNWDSLKKNWDSFSCCFVLGLGFTGVIILLH